MKILLCAFVSSYLTEYDCSPICLLNNFQIKEQPPNPDRPLPLDRNPVEEYELGYKEPTKVPLGKVTLKDAIKFISSHQLKPEKYTVTKIAEDYKLPEESVSESLAFFLNFFH